MEVEGRGYMSCPKKPQKIKKIYIEQSCEIHETKISITLKLSSFETESTSPLMCYNLSIFSIGRKVWKAITFLCGHSLLHDVVSPLCDVVSSLCDAVSPLCGVVSSLYDGVSPLRDVVLSICVVVSPLCDVVLSLCDVVSPLRGEISLLRGVFSS